jgi:hypothetical protein
MAHPTGKLEIHLNKMEFRNGAHKVQARPVDKEGVSGWSIFN